jgi:spore germination protein YaaH
MRDDRPTTGRRLGGRQGFGSRVSLAALVLGLAVSSGFTAAPVSAAGSPSSNSNVSATGKSDASASPDGPTIQYQEAMLHASESFAFTPGDAVTVPYTPRAGDPVTIDGTSPVGLPSGLASGRAIAATPATVVVPASDAVPVVPAPTARSSASASPNGTTNLLRREVYGFLPYWELGTPLNYDILSTIAYFGVGINPDGSLLKSGNGWSGWTSSKLTTVINAAHANKVRVALTITSFAWTTSGAQDQLTLLNSPANRAIAVANIVAQVQARGVDGVNLDFEPIANGTTGSNGFVNFVRELRTALDKVHTGYEIVFCATGHIGNYNAASLLAVPGGADAVFIMGYDFRTGSPALAGSIDPLTSPKIFDLTDSVNEYKARAPVSSIILGLPYYGRAWSTGTNQNLNAPPGDIPTYGGPASVYYSTAASMANTWGWRYDSVESTGWTEYFGDYGGTQQTWRQLYFDDAQSLAAKDDMVNFWNLRGSGIWALGEDGNAPELNAVIAAKFLTDKNPPKAGIVDLAPLQKNEGFAVSWTGRDDWNGVAGYDVQVSTDGGPFAAWLTGTTLTGSNFQGQTGHNYSFRVRATDGVGNVGAWDISNVYTASPALAIGGFGTVVPASLNERASPTVTDAVVRTAASGTVLQIIGGPVSADGYTWYQVTGPITEWNPVQPLFPGPWVAAGDGTNVYLAPSTPPNSTTVSAGIDALAVGTPGLQPSGTGIDRGKVFSPDADGIHDTVSMSWTNSAMTDVAINVYRGDGTSAGTIDLGAEAAGTHSYTWNGTVNGSSVLPDGQYLLQIAGTSGGSTYYSPSPAPFSAAQMASFGIVLDTTPTGTYYPAAPVRILDTRTGSGPTGALVSGTARKFTVAGLFNVPANAIAVTGNLTVAGPSGSGYVTLGPSLAGATSTINLAARDDRANGVTIGLAADGSLTLLYTGPARATAQAIFDLTGYFVRDPNGATFFPVTPTRIVDTRHAAGLKTALANKTVATFGVVGFAGVPAGATAVTGNVTVVGPASAGYVVVAPTIDPATTPLTSTINFPAGDTRANNVVVRLSGGKLQAEYVGKKGTSVQFLFDVTGYFVPGLSGATFVPLTPGRLVDSRIKVGFTGPLKTGTSAAFPASGKVSVHTIAVAVVGNLTITGQTSAGWLGVGPLPSSAVSTLNFPLGDVRSNGFVSFIGAGGTLTVTFGGARSSKAQVVLDVLGYYR